MSDRVQVIHADCRAAVANLADHCIDHCVTDGPYALVSIGKRFGEADAAPAKAREGGSGVYVRASAGFMGQKWDTGATYFDPTFWADVFRVLKPGGHVLAFAGTRTYHRLACAIEDAGFEIRDQFAWAYGSGFPKSHDVERSIARLQCTQPGRHYERSVPGEGKSEPGDHVCPQTPDSLNWAGHGTAVKPAWEPIVFARKPLAGTVAENVLAYGTGSLNIDLSRIGYVSEDDRAAAAAAQRLCQDSPGRCRFTGDGGTTSFQDPSGSLATFMAKQELGRWPANIIHDGSDEVLAAFPHTKSGEGAVKRETGSDRSGNTGTTFGAESRPAGTIMVSHGDEGSAARFFYTAKADADDRLGSKHPTIKPVALMAYLVGLVAAKGAVILDPFAGSGTTGVAAISQGCSAILIEREDAYVADIRMRIAHANGEGVHSGSLKARRRPPPDTAGPLFTAAE